MMRMKRDQKMKRNILISIIIIIICVIPSCEISAQSVRSQSHKKSNSGGGLSSWRARADPPNANYEISVKDLKPKRPVVLRQRKNKNRKEHGKIFKIKFGLVLCRELSSSFLFKNNKRRAKNTQKKSFVKLLEFPLIITKSIARLVSTKETMKKIMKELKIFFVVVVFNGHTQKKQLNCIRMMRTIVDA